LIILEIFRQGRQAVVAHTLTLLATTRTQPQGLLLVQPILTLLLVVTTFTQLLVLLQAQTTNIQFQPLQQVTFLEPQSI
jgi:hypothetical protein